MATNGHPATPPPTTKTDSQPTIDPDVPLTSSQDDGTAKRPRDARLIHLVLHSLGIHSYQERVPLQLLDFAYRYTSGILSDSLRLSAEGYAQTADQRSKKNSDDSTNITVPGLRQAIASRQGFTFQGALPKEFMMEEAAERNRIALPKVERSYGVQLPPEKHCLTGVGWNLKDEWSDEEDVPVEDAAPVAMRRNASQQLNKEDQDMGGMDGVQDGDEEGVGRMEDVFGEEDTNMTQD